MIDRYEKVTRSITSIAKYIRPYWHHNNAYICIGLWSSARKHRDAVVHSICTNGGQVDFLLQREDEIIFRLT